MKNAEILKKLGCLQAERADGSHDFVVPLTSAELTAIAQVLPLGASIVLAIIETGMGIRFRPTEGMSLDLLALAALRGVVTENAAGDGI